MPKVSVIIPTYNYGKYIEKAIDSILAQTYKDFEIIVVDDGSTDNTREIIESKYKNRLRYFYQENNGAPAARNKGIEESKGEYLVFLDADDWLMSGALLSRLEYLKKHSDCGWVYGACYYYDEYGRDVTERFHLYPFAYRNRREGNILGHMLLGELIHTPAVMINRDLLLDVGGFDITLPCLQDYELWLRVADQSPVGFIDECNVVVVTHEGSISQSGTDGYRTRLRIMRQAEIMYPEVVRTLGHKWQRNFAKVIAERGRHMTIEGDVSGGRRLLLEAIKKDPFYPRHFLGYVKTLLYFE